MSEPTVSNRCTTHLGLRVYPPDCRVCAKLNAPPAPDPQPAAPLGKLLQITEQGLAKCVDAADSYGDVLMHGMLYEIYAQRARVAALEAQLREAQEERAYWKQRWDNAMTQADEAGASAIHMVSEMGRLRGELDAAEADARSLREQVERLKLERDTLVNRPHGEER